MTDRPDPAAPAGAAPDAVPPGAELARRYWQEVVAPLLDRHLPGLPRAAGRWGSGSDVLGLDDALSRDHDWGLRLTLLLDASDAAAVGEVDRLLEATLPARALRRPTRFATTWDPRVRHRVEVATVRVFVSGRLGVPLPALHGADLGADLGAAWWLTLTGQAVLEAVGGPVFADTGRDLAPVRSLLARYPGDVDRYVLAAWWSRLGQRLPLVGRTATRGDELGSRILCASLARDLVRHAFAVERVWAPYDKWLGTCFTRLEIAPALRQPLEDAVSAVRWQDRERGLAAAGELLLAAQRRRDMPGPDRAVVPFFERPFAGVDPAVAAALLDGVTDPEVAALPPGVGSVEQWVDATDVLARPERRHAVTAAYTAWLGAAGRDARRLPADASPDSPSGPVRSRR